MTILLAYIPFVVATVATMLSVLLLLGNVLPTSAISASILAANSYIAVIGQFLPLTIGSLVLMVGALLLVEFYIGTYKLIKWVYTKIPGVS